MIRSTSGRPSSEGTPPQTMEQALARLSTRRPLDAAAAEAARERQGRLTKPAGSLGLLEDVSVRLSGLAGQCPPPMPSPAAVAVFAADHGVQVHGVSPWPQEVTAQMVGNFLAGGAGVNALAGAVDAQVVVVDVGVATPVGDAPALVRKRVRDGSRDLSTEAAMTDVEVRAALDVGVSVAARLIRDGHRCLLTGDMGIANTTASAALICAFTGADPERVTGRGTGIDDDTLQLKVDRVRAGLSLHADVIARRDTDPVAVLAAVGGLEHAAIAGFVIGAAASGVPVILDGVIAGSAALAASAIAPTAMDACIAGHCSAEPGHRVALEALGMSPLVDLGLRLGEGTGALLALPIVRASVAALRDMATFDSAGVDDGGLAAASSRVTQDPVT
jgi:nicotinate-nucleotide--dimethylbenzimidazole phosphoribosyltransferase